MLSLGSVTNMLIITVYLLISVYFDGHANGMIVHTDYGDVEGEVNSIGVAQFKKIPYAKPPIDDLRWTAPQPADAWQSTLDAKEQDVPACLQGCAPDDCFYESEDCLYLNIWTPVDAHCESNYAVIVWIHGGSFDSGEGDDATDDPSNFVQNIGDIIFVSVHYRVGIMGFLYDNTFNTGLRGNYGIQDQLLAIKWVYTNIHHFGGNKENIVVAGVSSGAVSVALHLLFNSQYIKAGIMHSPHFSTALRDPITWYDVPQQFSKLINCTASAYSDDDDDELLDCWRSVDADEILQVQLAESEFPDGVFTRNWASAVTWTPTVHTELLPNEPVHEWQNGDVETPPFIIGNTKDETFYFVDLRYEGYYGYDALFATFYATIMDEGITRQILDFYGATETSPYSSSYLYDMGVISNDAYICAIRNVLSNINLKHKKDIFYYSFDVVDEELFTKVIWNSDAYVACRSNTCHDTDIFYLFTAPMFTEHDLFDNDTLVIGKEMQRLWSNYVKTLNPNDNGYHVWPKYRNKKKPKKKGNFLSIAGVDEFVAKSTFVEPDSNFCEFWDQIGYAGDFSLATDLGGSPANAMAVLGDLSEVFSVHSHESHDTVLRYAYIFFGMMMAVIVMFIVAYSCWYNCKKRGFYTFNSIKNSMDDETEEECLDNDKEAIL